MTEIGSADLSEVVSRTLHITIQGVGDFTDGTWVYKSLAERVAVAAARIQHSSPVPHVANPRKSPWKVVSFDREAGKLVVAPA